MQYTGDAVSRGIAIGPVYRYAPTAIAPGETLIDPARAGEQIARYEAVRLQTGQQLEAICERLRSRGDEDKAKILAAHIDILRDVAIDREIKSGITDKNWSPDWAVRRVYDKFIAMFEKSKNALIRERATDLADVSGRLLRVWYGIEERDLSLLEREVIVVARDLMPSDTATMDREKVLAIVTERGGATSHTAIIAKSYGIPALLGVEGALENLREGQLVVVDAVDGTLLTDPDGDTQSKYREKREAFSRRTARAARYLDKKAVTGDGVEIGIHLNVGSANLQDLEGEPYTDGVGLLRTEFLYMESAALPTEEQQYQAYKKILTVYGQRPVTLRTLDIGGDKQLDCLCLPREENPFLGKRALRLCFDNEPLFRTQLRAALRASVHGNLRLMLPMVGSIDDIRRAKAILDDERRGLDAAGIAHSAAMQVGIMVEIPSIALIADLAAQEVDFASIGTNDLIQYTTAVDRMNPAVSSYYQCYHPALFRLIGSVVREFETRGKPVCICGEMGGDPLAIPVLIGLGMRHLSMSFFAVAPAKQLIAGLTTKRAQEMAEQVCGLPTAAAVETYLTGQLAEYL